MLGAIALLLLIKDWRQSISDTIDCGDGPRRTIDIRDFTTKYFGYSVKVEGEVTAKAKISVQLEPHLMQKLSDAAAQAKEQRQLLVAGFNSCGIPKVAFESTMKRFAALDSTSSKISDLLAKPSLNSAELDSLQQVIDDYTSTVASLMTK